MKKLSVFLAVAAWSCFAMAQTGTSVQTQTNANASSNTSVSTGSNGVNASNQTSVSGSQNTGAQRSGRQGRHDRSRANGSGNANTNANANSHSASVNGSGAAGTAIDAVLTKPIDSRKAKEGDVVVAKTTQTVKAAGQTTIPKGTRLIGHVTRSSSRAKGDSQSALGIVFDRAQIGKKREIPVHAVIQAVASAQTASAAALNPDQDNMGSGPAYPAGGSAPVAGGGGLVGGALGSAGNTVGNTAGAVGGTTGNIAGNATGTTAGTLGNTAGSLGATTASTLNANSSGVIGMPGYALQLAGDSATQGSLITSNGKEVKLSSGTRMVLRVVSE